MKGDKAKLNGSITVHNPFIIGNNAPENDALFSKDDLCLPRMKNEMKYVKRLPKSNSMCFGSGDWLSEKSVKKIQEKVDYESSDIRNMYNKLVESERNLQNHLDNIIEKDLETKKRKVRLLSKKWHEQTYLPLTKKIVEEMNGDNFEKLDKEKRRQYSNYLDHHNNKEGRVYLDVFAPEEYNPLYLNSKRPGPLKAVTKKLSDPLLHLQDKHNEEERVVIACDKGEFLTDKEIESYRFPKLPLIPLGRHGTLCSTWLDMELTDIQSDVRVRSQERRKGVRNNSTFEFKGDEMGSSPRKSNSDLSCDKMWQKRKQFPEKYDTTIELI